MNAQARKTHVSIIVNHKYAIRWEARPDLTPSVDGEAVLDIDSVPRLTVNKIGSFADLQEGDKVEVHTKSIKRSNYWQQTSHPYQIAMYEVVEGKLRKVKVLKGTC